MDARRETGGGGSGRDTAEPALEGNHSKVIRHEGGWRWRGVRCEAYKASGSTWRGMTRRELIGRRGESPLFHVRYFEIDPGGFSSLERHRHEHAVVVLRGRGEVRLGCGRFAVGVGDVIYVAPDDPHQFLCPAQADEPFGFLCIVNAERDRPVALDGPEACGICE
ncbi:MAG: cupin domain-containing protein [Acidobacteria bacterium]|nr:MAG: cupin domain-containing protein [Acidobacteriota bacterium]